MQSVSKSVDELIERSQTVIFDCYAIFPLDIVPDRILIDLTKIIIIYREPLGMETEHTILLNEVRDVDVDVTYFIGTLRILASGVGLMWTSITNLHKKDAMLAKHLIEGLLIARAEHYDFNHFAKEELIHQLALLGTWNQGSVKSN